MDILEQTKKKMNAALDHLKAELKMLRTGRANPAMVENVMVEVYGAQMRLKDIASISVPEPRQLLITPFDPKNASSISKGIEAANLNLRPVVDGNVIRIRIAEMDASVRQEMAKQAKKKCEDAKVAIRGVRRTSNEEAKKEKLPEDMIKKLEKNIQEQTDKFCKLADEVTAEKEKEIQTV